MPDLQLVEIPTPTCPQSDPSLDDASTAVEIARDKNDEALQLVMTGDPESLRLAVDAAQEAYGILLSHMLYSTNILANLLGVCLQKYRCSRDMSDLETGISLGEGMEKPQDLKETDPPDTIRLGLQTGFLTLGLLHGNRYEHQKQTEDLVLAISYTSRALSMPVDSEPFTSDPYLNLGEWKLAMYKESHDIQDLTHCINAYEQALLLTSIEDPDRASHDISLAKAFLVKYERTHEATSLDGSIQAMREALSLTSLDHPYRPQMLANFAYCLEKRFKRSDSQEDLDTMIQVFEEAKKTVDAGQENRFSPLILNIEMSKQYTEDEPVTHSSEFSDSRDMNARKDVPESLFLMIRLADFLLTRWKRRGAELDLNHSIDLFQEAHTLSKPHREFRGPILDKYYTCLVKRYGCTSDRNDLHLSIGLLEERVEMLPNSHPMKLDKMMAIASNTLELYNQTENTIHIEKAQKLAQHVFDEADPSHPNRADWLETYSRIQEARFKVTRDLQTINDAVRLSHEAFELVKHAQDSRPDKLYTHGDLLAQRFRHSGNIDDLNKGIEAMDESVKLGTNKASDKTQFRRCSLAWWLMVRFDRTGDMRNLDSAIQHAKQGVAEKQDARSLSILAQCYEVRYRRDSRLADLDKSIEVLQRWAGNEKGSMVSNLKMLLAKSLLARGEGQKSKMDIDRSIVQFEQILKTLPEQGLYRIHCQYGLAVALQSRYLMFGRRSIPWSFEDIDYSLKILNEIKDQPNQEDLNCLILSVLGHCYKIRRMDVGTSAQLDNELSLRYFTRCFDQSMVSIITRIDGAKEASMILDSQSRTIEAAALLKKAINLLPALNLRTIPTLDQQLVLEKVTGIASLATALVLKSSSWTIKFSSKLYEALSLLERGRGIISSLLTETRTDMSILDRDVASELLEARQAVSALNPATHRSLPVDITRRDDVASFPDFDVKTRHAAESRVLAIIDRIHADPKTREFLQPPTLNEVVSVLGDDNIIVVNASPIRCDAFLISKQRGVRLVELTSLKLEDIMKHAQSLRLSRPFINPSLLEWMWNTIASPVLDELGIRTYYGDQAPPRLFWILTGPLTQLPIHAAGRHGQASKETVLDRAMSSYCSSLRSFVYSRKAKARVNDDSQSNPVGKALLVAMRETPKQSTLVFATKEIQAIESSCSLLRLEPWRLIDESREAVLAEIGAHIFHFAGHGRSDPRDPSQSGLLLKDAVLTVADIREHNMGSRMPFLGYLSACLTAANDVPKLADESINLLTAFQLAGFRHLIGSLWQLHDDACVKMAESVYHNLATGGMTDLSVCAALHDACVHFRDDWVTKMFSVAAPPDVEAASGVSPESDGKGNEGCQQQGRDGRLRPKNSTPVGVVKADWVPYVHYGP